MHSDGSGLISGVWNILAAAIGPVFGVSVIIWNVMPFCAHCDADSKNRKLADGISEEDLAYLAELQKLWITVPPSPPEPTLPPGAAHCQLPLRSPHFTLPAHTPHSTARTASSHSTRFRAGEARARLDDGACSRSAAEGSASRRSAAPPAIGSRRTDSLACSTFPR